MYWNKIGSHHAEGMVVERNPNHIVQGRVDDSKQILLPCGHRDFSVCSPTVGIFIGPIDNDVVRVWWTQVVLKIAVYYFADLGRCLIVEIVDKISSEVDVIVGSRRTIDNNSTKNTVSILR